MRTWKIIYWHNGNKNTTKLQAASRYAAKVRFYVLNPSAAIINIEEVKDDV